MLSSTGWSIWSQNIVCWHQIKGSTTVWTSCTKAQLLFQCQQKAVLDQMDHPVVIAPCGSLTDLHALTTRQTTHAAHSSHQIADRRPDKAPRVQPPHAHTTHPPEEKEEDHTVGLNSVWGSIPRWQENQSVQCLTNNVTSRGKIVTLANGFKGYGLSGIG